MTRRSIAVILLTLALCVSGPTRSWAGPKPDAVPSSWQFQIQLGQLRSIRMRAPGEIEPRTFWYLRYRLINRTGDERKFIPQIALYTKTGQLIRASQDVPTAVHRQIKSIYNDPLLRSQSGMTGRILQGADNAPRGVMIFRDFDPDAGQVDIFIGGLSGETVRIQLPQPVQVKSINDDGELIEKEVRELTLSKTLRLTYEISGDLKNRRNLSASLKEKEWIMR
jgi:hypothetical protein